MSHREGPFHPLQIEAVPCDMETAREHLRAFVRAFVRSDRLTRAEHLSFRLAPKQPDRLGALHQLLDDRYISPPHELSLPSNLPATGVYFAGRDEAWVLSLSDAQIASSYLCRDAVWSGLTGVYAAFLHHEGSQLLCYRPSTAAS